MSRSRQARAAGPPGGRAWPGAAGIGPELRALREALGLGLRAAAREIGWSAATLSRTENGLRAATPEEIAGVLDAYKITGPLRDRLLTLAREAERPGWWEAGRSEAVPPELMTLIAYEARATRIVEIQLVLIPGLLQTPGYTRALMRAAGVRPQDIEARVALRLGRQAVLTRPDPLDYVVLLDEAVLHRAVGGPAEFAHQLRRLAELAGRPNISIQVLPYGCGAHAALTGAHLIIDFAEAPTIVHIEQRRGSVFLDRPEDVRPFVADIDTLLFTALDARRSAELITAIAARHERTAEADLATARTGSVHERHQERNEHGQREEREGHEEHEGHLELQGLPEHEEGEGHGSPEEHSMEKIRTKWYGNRLRRGGPGSGDGRT